MMDALSPRHPAQRVVFMKGSQLGASESGCNWIGYVIHHAPGPMLAVQPSVELAKRFSQQRIDPLIEESPTLREKVAPARSRDSGNTVLSKEFPGGILVMTGANSAVGLRSMPVRYLFLDEVDAYPPSADDEGDPVALAEAGRGRSRGGARCSSPRRRRSRGCRASSGNTRPRISGATSCRARTAARRSISSSSGCAGRRASRRRRPTSARAARQPIAEHHKTKMLAEGKWRPTATPADPLSIGFHLSSLYSPVGWLSWERIAREWEACQTSEEAKRNCLVATEDEGYTYNKQINRLSTIQEHNMIRQAIDKGLSPEQISRALNVNVAWIRERQGLLRGIAAEVAELLKDRQLGGAVFSLLRKMKPLRQIEVAELMIAANRLTVSYARALLAATPKEQLAEPEKPKSISGVSAEAIARMEEEMDHLQRDYRYGSTMLNLVVAKGYVGGCSPTTWSLAIWSGTTPR